MSDQGLLALVSLSEYREGRQRVFPSNGSLQWYLRQHKAGLVAAGALLLIAGRWQVAPDSFDAYVIRIGASDAKAQPAALVD